MSALRRNTSGRFPAFAHQRGEIAALTPGCLFNRSHPSLFRCSASRGRFRFSQVPCEPLVHSPWSQTSSGPPRQAGYGVSVLPPVITMPKAPEISSLTRLNTRLLHWLFTLHAALLGDDAKLTSGGLPNLAGWAFSCPLSSTGEFLLSLSPLPGLNLARRNRNRPAV